MSGGVAIANAFPAVFSTAVEVSTAVEAGSDVVSEPVRGFFRPGFLTRPQRFEVLTDHSSAGFSSENVGRVW